MFFFGQQTNIYSFAFLLVGIQLYEFADPKIFCKRFFWLQILWFENTDNFLKADASLSSMPSSEHVRQAEMQDGSGRGISPFRDIEP